MPASEREWMRDAPTERISPRRPRLARGRLALWIVVTVCLMLGGAASAALAWVWALILVAALLLVVGLLAAYWLFPDVRR